jgi:hypothetical protein
MNTRNIYAVISLIALSGCTLFTPKASEPTDGLRARVRVIGGGGDLVVSPARQPGEIHGSFVAHSFLYPGARQKLGMPDRDQRTGSADEYYVVGDQDVRVYFKYDVILPGDKFTPGRREKCGPIDGEFHAAAGMDYEVSASFDPQHGGCVINVTSIVSKDGCAVAFLPVPIQRRKLG